MAGSFSTYPESVL